MTVLQINKEKYKIVLTHTEVNLCFGSYERLREMGTGVITAIKILASDIAFENFKNVSLKAQVAVAIKENCGAQIFLCFKEKAETQTVVHFEDSNSLTDGLIVLYKKGLHKGELYKMEKGYRLILKQQAESLFIINEFAKFIKSSYLLAEQTREYGRILADEKGIEEYVLTFLERL